MLSRLDDLGLAPFDAIIIFQQPLASGGFERCLGVPADPIFIHAQKAENQLFSLVQTFYLITLWVVRYARAFQSSVYFCMITCRDLQVLGLY